ncbi:hypothetical protein AB0H83_51500 [Dactylosporangium sp. NPDC050688]|uniref:hypothetical protein n=1 Tax=Dactylosporangium sp. NPDC050688 TaxID=3157217 RepID=UPI0033EDB196
MTDILAAGAAVLVAGFPGAWLMARRLPLALLLVPLTAGLTATAAVLLMLVAGGALVWWALLLVAGQCVLLLRAVHRGPGRPLPHAGWLDSLCYVVPLLPPLTTVRLVPVQWDAHAIWWLHAGYFALDSATARSAIGDSRLAFSHTDYPPLLSAVVAGAWRVGGADLRVAQFTSTLVTAAGFALLAYAVRANTAGLVPAWASRLAAAVVALAAWGFYPVGVVEGLADSLWAATFAAGAVFLLVGRDGTERDGQPRDGPEPRAGGDGRGVPEGSSRLSRLVVAPVGRLALPVLLLTVAALVKTEGSVAVTELAVVATLRYRRRLGAIWPVWLPVIAGQCWSRLAARLGATSDLVAGGHFTGLLQGDPAVWNRLPPTVDSLWSLLWPVTVPALAAAVLGAVFLGGRRAVLGLGGDGWLWLTYALFLATLFITYLTSPNDINWHLSTSANRIIGPLCLLAVVSAVFWGIVGAHSLSRPPAAAATPAAAPRP